MFHYLSCSIKRRMISNLITVGISIMLVVLLSLYFGGIRSYEEQLADLAENVPIYCQIVNLNGTLGNGLFIPERTIDSLQQSGHVKDLSYMTVMLAGEGDFKEAEYSKYLNLHVVAANTVEAVGELPDDIFSMDKAYVDALLSSDRPECIVNENVLKRHDWHIGGKIILKCYYYDPASEFNKIEIHPMGGVVEFEIAGTMEDITGKTNAIATDVIIPAKTARNIFEQSALPFFADTVTFHINDPMDLNAFKANMQEIGLMNITPEATDSYTGCALTVRDAAFIASATDLRQVIGLMTSFFPVICILILMIGYVVSYLSGNSRKKEYALLRLQGVKKIKASLLFLTEHMILIIIGLILGDTVMVLTISSFITIAVANLVILSAYLIGATAAYGQMSKKSVIYLLCTQQ